MKKIILVLGVLLLGLLSSGCGREAGKSVSPPESAAAAQAKLGKLAYLQNGGLWVKELPDGAAKKLADGSAVFNPRWSPAGKWLLFQKKEELWVTDATSAKNRLIASKYKEAVWSAADEVIFYTTDQHEVIKARPEGGETRVLVGREPGVEIGRIISSPDGRFIALEISRKKTANSRENGLWQVDTLNGKTRVLYSTLVNYTGASLGQVPYLAGWSVDGKTVYFWAGSSAASVTADGVPFSALNAEDGKVVPLDGSEKNYLVHRNWFASAPDPSFAVVIAGGGRETWIDKQLGLIDLRTQKITMLTAKDQAVSDPAFSPSGDRLAYSANPVGPGFNINPDRDYSEEVRKIMMQQRIWLVKTNGGRPEQLTNDSDYRDQGPVWTANGDYLLFIRSDRNNKTGIWIMRPDGSELRQVAENISPVEDSLGYYGYIGDRYFDYWSGKGLNR